MLRVQNLNPGSEALAQCTSQRTFGAVHAAAGAAGDGQRVVGEAQVHVAHRVLQRVPAVRLRRPRRNRLLCVHFSLSLEPPPVLLARLCGSQAASHLSPCTADAVYSHFVDTLHIVEGEKARLLQMRCAALALELGSEGLKLSIADGARDVSDVGGAKTMTEAAAAGRACMRWSKWTS